MKPIVKWVGGKTQLLNELTARLPNQYNDYYEAFVGGGALLFNLQPLNAHINDYNAELINLYRVIRDNPNELIRALKRHRNTSTYYYKIRSWDRSPTFNRRSDVIKASRILYLNKTCFNGLYRVNAKGYYNSPFGRYKKPLICDEDNILAISNYFRHIDIQNQDFETFAENAQVGDFIYFDPPYDILSTTSSFTSYNAGGFDRNEQIRLKNLCDRLTQRGVLWMLSNANTEFIRNLYAEYNIDVVHAKRYINSDGKKRGDVEEVIIRNYA